MQPMTELSDLSARLCAKWPPRAYGVRQIVWPEERLTLTLHIGLIEAALPQAHFKADAWFLDGFSPAKNAAMWDDVLWPMIAERSAPHARVGTFTVAGSVRRGLSSVGFEVEKRSGHARKRERLEATFSATSEPASKLVDRPKVAVIGAGSGGACLAYRLKQRGAEVTVFERLSEPGNGTSGNPLALMMPRLDAGDTAQARLLIDAYLHAQAFYADMPGITYAETLHRPRDEKEAERFRAVLADPPLGLEQLEAVRGDGLLHKKSLIIQPKPLISHLLDGQRVELGYAPKISLAEKTIDGTSFDAIVLASGWQLSQLVPELAITGRLGQIEWVESALDTPPSAIAQGHYALTNGGQRLWGATFADHSGGQPEASQMARDQNFAALDGLSPYWLQDAKRGPIRSRAGVRATTADRLPLIGALPDATRMQNDRQTQERAQWRIGAHDYGRSGLFVASGYGSRGFTWAPWAAAILTASIFDDPAPARLEALSAVAPNRQVLRQLKRGNAISTQKT